MVLTHTSLYGVQQLNNGWSGAGETISIGPVGAARALERARASIRGLGERLVRDSLDDAETMERATRILNFADAVNVVARRGLVAISFW